MTRREILVSSVAAAGSLATPAAADPTITVYPWGRRYRDASTGHEVYVLGETPAEPRPTLLVLHSQPEQTLLNVKATPGEFVQRLMAAKPNYWTICSVATPGHFYPDHFADEPWHLASWPDRYSKGRTLWDLGFFGRVAYGLSVLEWAGYSIPGRVAAWGSSRGGFCALHAAARELRIKWVAALSPVTRLNDLRPYFDGHPNPEACAQEDIANLASLLVNKRILMTTNAIDPTVSTQAIHETYWTCFNAGISTGTCPDHSLLTRGVPGHKTESFDFPLVIDWLNLRAEKAP